MKHILFCILVFFGLAKAQQTSSHAAPLFLGPEYFFIYNSRTLSLSTMLLSQHPLCVRPYLEQFSGEDKKVVKKLMQTCKDLDMFSRRWLLYAPARTEYFRGPSGKKWLKKVNKWRTMCKLDALRGDKSSCVIQ